MTKYERANGDLGQMSAAQIDGPGIMVPLHPNPVTASLQAGDPEPILLGQCQGRAKIIEAVAEADDSLGRAPIKIVVKAGQRVPCFIRWQGRRTAPQQPFGLSQMKIGDTEHPFIRPPKRAGSKGDQTCIRKRKGMTQVHASFFVQSRLGRKPMLQCFKDETTAFEYFCKGENGRRPCRSVSTRDAFTLYDHRLSSLYRMTLLS